MRVYNYTNYDTLEFMRYKFHELSEKLELKIAHRADNANAQKYNFWKLKLMWKTLKMKMKMKMKTNLVCFTCKKVVLFEKLQFSTLTQTDS